RKSIGKVAAGWGKSPDRLKPACVISELFWRLHYEPTSFSGSLFRRVAPRAERVGTAADRENGRSHPRERPYPASAGRRTGYSQADAKPTGTRAGSARQLAGLRLVWLFPSVRFGRGRVRGAGQARSLGPRTQRPPRRDVD